MTMQNDTKNEEKITCCFKIDMRNFTNLCFNWLLVTKVHYV